MTLRLVSLAAIAAFTTTAALAQTTVTTTVVTTSSAPAVEGTTAVAPPPRDPDDFTQNAPKVQTDEQGKLLIGERLDTSRADSLPLSDDNDTLFVIDSNNLKPSGEWTAADRQACSASGGVELPISAGRVACFKL